MLQLEATLARRVRAKPNFFALLDRMAVSGWFAYTTILLLQLKVVWRIWNFKDLTPDDTAYYFTVAHSWYTDLRTVFPLSPLYTVFYGSFLHVAPDAYFATVAHRIVIVLVLAALVLCVMRRFLPPSIAWLMAAWWVVLPIDFDNKYEVHLFSVIPLLVVVLLSAWKSQWAAPSALAVFVGTVLLVRNEYLIGAVPFALALLVYEVRRFRRDGARKVRRTSARYVVAAVPVLVLTCFLFLRAGDASTMAQMANDKHRLNWCQVYTYGYEQRHRDYTASPWSECSGLMNRTFGTPQPSMLESLRRNPGAVMEHFTWNLSLIPNGLELLLFNVIGGSATPDYHPVTTNPALTAVLVATLLGIIVSGLIVMYRERAWWVEVFESETWPFIAMACIAFVAAFVMLTQRPRPSYLLALGIFARLATGMAIWAVSRGGNTLSFRRAVAVLACVLIIAVPSAYRPGARNRPLLNAYRRLQPFEQTLREGSVRLVSRGWGQELCNYVVAGVAPCTPLVYSDIHSQSGTPSRPFAELLEARQANVFYVDEGIFGEEPVQQLLAEVPANGWTQIGSGQVNGNHWALLIRNAATHHITDFRSSDDATTPGKHSDAVDIVAPADGIGIGKGWYAFEAFDGRHFRWINNDAELVLAAGSRAATLNMDVQPGPGAEGKPLRIRFLDQQGATAATASVSRFTTISARLPVSPTAAARYRIHIDGGGAVTPFDARILNLRVFRVSRSPSVQ